MMNHQSPDQEQDDSAKIQSLLLEAAKLFEEGLARAGKREMAEDACKAGGSLRLTIDFNMPTRITGYATHGHDQFELFGILFQPYAVECGHSSH